MRNLVATFALALLCACAGYTNGSNVGGGPDANVGLDVDSGPDGGADGGDGGADGGPDAGCEARTLNGSAVDNCQGGAFSTVSGFVTGPAQGCNVQINLSTVSTPCLGTASRGTLDAFDGGCGPFPSCTSPSIPGTLTCTTATGTCTIVICDAGTCP